MLAMAIAMTMLGPGNNLLLNGSFEEPDVPPGTFGLFEDIPGWTSAKGGGYEIWDHLFGWTSAEGDQHLETNQAVIEQTIDTAPGLLYKVTFAWAPRPTVPDNHVIVEWDGHVIAEPQASGVGVGDLQWTYVDVIVGATGNETTLRVTADNDDPLVGMQVDDFRVEAHCGADIDGNGVLNILDFVAFQAAWTGQSPIGDCDGNGLFNILDFVCFQGRFVAGCR